MHIQKNLDLRLFVYTLNSWKSSSIRKKDAENKKKHGFSLAEAEGFDLDSALIVEDDRYGYGEDRFQAIGLIEGKLTVVVLVFTPREDRLRAISLRRANKKERTNYALYTQAYS